MAGAGFHVANEIAAERFSLFREYYDELVRYLTAKLRSRDQAQDVAQEAFLRVLTQSQQQMLTAGERISYSAQGGLSAITAIDIAAETAWTTDEMIFDERPLGEVVQEIGRYHPGEIRVLDPRLSERKISGRFSVHDREAFLRAVKAATRAQSASLGGNVIVLSE